MSKGSKRRKSATHAGVQRRYQKALELHQAGHWVRAAEEYAGVVQAAPGWAEPWHGFGVLGMQVGEPKKAVERLRRATELAPERADFQSNLGGALEATGDFVGAKAAYGRALALEPEDIDTLFNLGLAHTGLGEHAEARDVFARASELAPDDAEIQLNLSRAYLKLEDFSAARSAAEGGRRLPAVNDEIHAGLAAQLGAICSREGTLEQALSYYEEAVTLGAGEAETLANLGAVCHELGRFDDAEHRYRQALQKNPNLFEVHLNLARLDEARGRLESAYRGIRRARKIAPSDAVARRLLARILRHAYPSGWDAELFRLLARCFEDEAIDVEDLVRASAAQLLVHPEGIGGRIEQDLPDSAVLTGGALRPVLLRLLSRAINTDYELETLLRGWRERLGIWLDAGGVPDPKGEELLVAFAEQAFSNEYVWSETAPEHARVERLTRALSAELAESQAGRLLATTRRLILQVALYRNLHCVANIERILEADTSDCPGLARLILRSVRQPKTERTLGRSISALGVIANATSVAVREQYEASPYPRWLSLPDRSRGHLREFLRRRFPRLDVSPLDTAFKVLVAGCGTGQEPLRLATGCPEAEVVGMDLSLASLGYTARMQAELGVENLTLFHGDLLSVGLLGKFDVIISNGVLHHMADPLAGWRALVEQLTPGGLMKIGLYSEAARGPIVAARAFIEERGLTPDLGGIRALRETIGRHELPALSGLLSSEDFYAASACRDLLFHTCEHRFTLAQIGRYLNTLGLELIGFEAPDGLASERFRATDPSLSTVARWESVEAQHTDTFAGMYQFWVHSRA